MIPTVFGVIILTFILFNVAGGDPAIVKLGKQATARSLEEYDLQKGLNKPLLCGLWGNTRAFSEVDFKDNAGPWSHVEGVLYTNSPVGCIVLSHYQEYSVPMALQLNVKEEYRWCIECRRLLRPYSRTTNNVSKSDWPRNRGKACWINLLICDGSNVMKEIGIDAGTSWRT